MTICEEWTDVRERLGLCTCAECWSRYLRVFLDEDHRACEREAVEAARERGR